MVLELARKSNGLFFIPLQSWSKGFENALLCIQSHPDLETLTMEGHVIDNIKRQGDLAAALVASHSVHTQTANYVKRKAVQDVQKCTSHSNNRRQVTSIMFREGIKKRVGACFQIQVVSHRQHLYFQTWIVGKWITPREQWWTPKETHFHQFVVPPIIDFRRDRTYWKLAAMKLLEDVEGLGMCEYMMERGVVHACHAGGVVYSLEGWSHHEVGAIEVDRIDEVWDAAMKHGLKPV